MGYVAYCQGLLALFMNESFPDRVKSSGNGIIEALSNLGNLITPFVVSMTSNAGLSPVFVVSVILILGIVPLLPTKETFHHLANEKEVEEEEKNEKDIIQSLITNEDESASDLRSND